MHFEEALTFPVTLAATDRPPFPPGLPFASWGTVRAERRTKIELRRPYLFVIPRCGSISDWRVRFRTHSAAMLSISVPIDGVPERLIPGGETPKGEIGIF